jgi:hypothetical protein
MDLKLHFTTNRYHREGDKKLGTKRAGNMRKKKLT